jgi:hypothetical protein
MCFSCHSADFAKIDDLVPERSAGYLGGGNAMPDMNGRIVKTANITPDAETGIGKWSEDEFVHLVRFGVRPDKSVIMYPMVPYPELTDDDAPQSGLPAHGALIKNAVARIGGDRQEGMPAARPSTHGCHADTGVGLYDLRKGPRLRDRREPDRLHPAP